MKGMCALACVAYVASACGHAPPARPTPPAPPASPPPTDETVTAMYTAGNWHGLADVCERQFAASPGAQPAACVAIAEAKQGHVDAALAWLDRAVGAGFDGPDASDPDFASIAQDARFRALAAETATRQRERNIANAVGSDLVASTPSAEGVDAVALDKLVLAAGAAKSSALVVFRHGKLVGQWYFGGESVQTETMSATKGIASLAVGALLQDGLIASIDTPMTTWFTEWKDGVHDEITLRHVLSHVSNLDAPRTAIAIYKSGDATRYALGLPMAGPAGAAFFYNNAAVNLIAALVQRVTGKSLQDYATERLFAPLGIRDVSWQRDGKDMPFAMSGLRIHAVDFAKLGQLVLQRGAWNGKQLVPTAYIASLATPAQRFEPTSSLLWWIGYPRSGKVFDDAFFTAAAGRGVPAAILAKLEPLRGKEIASTEFFGKLRDVFGADALRVWIDEIGERKLSPTTVTRGEADELSARGSFDQLLLVFPSRDLVVARFTQMFDEAQVEVSSFPQLDTLARALVPAP